MPDIFRGIHLNPLQSGNSFYLLWMVLGYLIVSSVLIVSLGRLGDMFGRVRIYNLGFVIYTAASLMLTIDWMTGSAGASYLVVFRLFQGVGGAFLLANSAAILTDAFPANQRGMALGINNIVGVSGMFVGLVLGGLLAPISWRMVFLISVPVGLFGTVWAYMQLRELSTPQGGSKVDWPGNITFALGLILIMVSITYGIRPYGGHATGWLSPRVLSLLGAGVLSLDRVRDLRTALGRSDVPATAPAHPCVQPRHHLHVPGVNCPWWPDVHADHLATGDLASATRRRLHGHPAARGSLHAASHDRDAHRRPHLGDSVRPLRRTTVRDRRHGRHGDHVRRCCGCFRPTLPMGHLRRFCFSWGYRWVCSRRPTAPR